MDIKIVLVLTIIFGGIELLICKFFRKIIVKFILPIVLFVISLFFIFFGKLAPLEGMQDLAYIVTGILAGISSLISFVVAIIYLFVYKRADK
jgi:hypothetical protein